MNLFTRHSVLVVAVLACAPLVVGQNPIYNGDFEQGNEGFDTDLLYSNDLSWSGHYTIGTDPSNHHDGFPSYGDHTTGYTLMMIINGSTSENQIVWRQEVAVEPLQEYSLEGWISLCSLGQAPDIEARVNGEVIGTYDSAVIENRGEWHQFQFVWTSDNSGTAVIEFANLTGWEGGNDFAIDDISLSPTLPSCLTLTVDNLVAGDVATFTVSDGVPGADCAILWSMVEGSYVVDNGVWCARFELKLPPNPQTHLVAAERFDVNGVFEAKVRVPKGAAGLDVCFQAALKGTCPDICMSNKWCGIIQ
ncbi:MAG: hypothetical protein D8M59_13965 [Planctomycetes bacterium]|nr:hypothetical protein [Planctomycetota bacterium]NOG55614.1 hypothetical protein [Planctomycetota bacterium]